MAAIDFSSGSVKKRIIAQAIPMTTAQAVQLLYNVVDRIYIGHLDGVGDLALTGLGITFPVIILIAAFTNLLGTGGNALFSIARGRGDDEEAEKILGNVFALLVSASVCLFLFCYFLRRPILFLFGASEQSFFYADQYLKIYLFGTTFSMLSTGLNGYINAQGYPRMGMMTTVLGAGLNILLDPIFIFSLNMGVSGAALATVISQSISALWVLRFLTAKAPVTIRRQRIRVEKARTLRIMSLGLPGFVMQGTNSLVSIVCNNQLQAYGGDLYVGILTVINSVREIASLPLSGLSGGAQPVMGYNYGAEKHDRVRESIRFISVLGCIYGVATWLMVMLFPRTLIGIFSSDPQTIEVGAKMLNIYFFGFFFMALMFAGQTTYQALGKAKQAIFFSLLRKAVIVVPMTLLLPAVGFGVEGVFLAEPVSNVIGALACFITMWFTLYRRL